MANTWLIKDASGNVITKSDAAYSQAFHSGYAVCEKDGEYNYMNTERELLSEVNFLSAEDFSGDTAKVGMAGGARNILKLDGSLLSESGFDFIGDFHDGLARYRSDGKWYFTDEAGRSIGDGFDYVTDFSGGYARYRTGSKWGLVGTDGQAVTDAAYDGIEPIAGGFHIVRTDTEDNDTVTSVYNYLKEDGTALSDSGWDEVTNFNEGMAAVRTGSEWSFITEDGQPLTDDTYSYASPFLNSQSRVRRADGTWNIIGADGQAVSDEGFKRVGCMVGGYTRVYSLDGYANFVDGDGNQLLTSSPYTDARDFANGYAAVYSEDGWGFIGTDGLPACSGAAYDAVTDFIADGTAEAQIEGWWYRIDTEGNPLRRLCEAETVEDESEYADVEEAAEE